MTRRNPGFDSPAGKRPPCTCETFGNGVVSGNDGRLPPPEGCQRHGPFCLGCGHPIGERHVDEWVAMIGQRPTVHCPGTTEFHRPEGGTVRHTSDSNSFIEDDDGFFTAACSCGWTLGPLPGVEEVCDVLMDHAARGYRDVLKVIADMNIGKSSIGRDARDRARSALR